MGLSVLFLSLSPQCASPLMGSSYLGAIKLSGWANFPVGSTNLHVGSGVLHVISKVVEIYCRVRTLLFYM